MKSQVAAVPHAHHTRNLRSMRVIPPRSSGCKVSQAPNRAVVHRRHSVPTPTPHQRPTATHETDAPGSAIDHSHAAPANIHPIHPMDRTHHAPPSRCSVVPPSRHGTAALPVRQLHSRPNPTRRAAVQATSRNSRAHSGAAASKGGDGIGVPSNMGAKMRHSRGNPKRSPPVHAGAFAAARLDANIIEARQDGAACRASTVPHPGAICTTFDHRGPFEEVDGPAEPVVHRAGRSPCAGSGSPPAHFHRVWRGSGMQPKCGGRAEQVLRGGGVSPLGVACSRCGGRHACGGHPRAAFLWPCALQRTALGGFQPRDVLAVADGHRIACSACIAELEQTLSGQPRQFDRQCTGCGQAAGATCQCPFARR
jgi:hypothetical protein